VAASLAPTGLPGSAIPPRFLARGCYFSLSGLKTPFRRLIYPVPEPGGLGVHLTLDLAGQAKFGPDVEWVAEVAYPVDPTRWAGLPAQKTRVHFFFSVVPLPLSCSAVVALYGEARMCPAAEG
jgi:hypothetical protein